MKNLTLVTAAAVTCALGAAFAPQAISQQAYPSTYVGAGASAAVLGQPGAGGQGGSGAAPSAFEDSPRFRRENMKSGPPPLEPTRNIYAVDCTRPFDPAGKGNLRCL